MRCGSRSSPTTEGGAITGEERLREHTDQLYGAILSYEGKPAIIRSRESTRFGASWATRRRNLKIY
jgi:hypothetical protein